MSETSQIQIEANRENGKLGGVKTDAGKAVSKYNAIKHGLLSEQILFKDENGDELLELEKKMRAELAPASEIEFLLVDKIISGIWRLRRALSIEEDEVFSFGIFDKKLGISSNSDRFFRYEIMLERSIYKALHELERIQAKRNGENVPPPIALDVEISGGKENGFVS